MLPGTYLTSISTHSPAFIATFMYLYLIRLTRYFLTNPSLFKISPIVRGGTTNPSFSICQCSFKAHFFVSILNSMICSLIRIGVSFSCVLRAVDFGSSPASPHCLYAATHLSSVRLP